MTFYKPSQSFTFKPPIQTRWSFYFCCFGNLRAGEGHEMRWHDKHVWPHKLPKSLTDSSWIRARLRVLRQTVLRSGNGPPWRRAHVLAGPSLTSAFSFCSHSLISSYFVCENKPWAHPPLQWRRWGVCSLRHSPDVSSCHKGSINLARDSRPQHLSLYLLWRPMQSAVKAPPPPHLPLRGLRYVHLAPWLYFV